MEYRDLELRLFKYTDGWNMSEGSFPLDSKQELEAADAILKKRYSKVDKHHLDMKNKEVDGTDYKIEFSEPYLDEERKKKELTFLPDKDPSKANDGPMGTGLGQTTAISEEDDSSVFSALVNDYNLAEELDEEETLEDVHDDVLVSDLPDLEEDIEKHNELNPDLFENNELKPDVKEKIEHIVQVFEDNLAEDQVELDIKDILIIGSNASYNYTKDSDIDVHIVANMTPYEGEEDLATKLYQCYKQLFNNKYDPTIFGHEVELYVEPEESKAKSNGIYSLRSGWVKEPEENIIPEVDMDDVNAGVYPFAERAKEADTIEDIDKVIDDIYIVRQKGMLNGGEYSKDNLIFKEFRNQGYLQMLKDKKVELENKDMSLEESLHLEEADMNGNEVTIEEVANRVEDIIRDLVSGRYFKVKKRTNEGGNDYKYTFLPTSNVKHMCMDQSVWDEFDQEQYLVINKYNEDGDSIIQVDINYIDDVNSFYFNYDSRDSEKSYEGIRNLLDSMITDDAVEYNVKEANRVAGFYDESLQESAPIMYKGYGIEKDLGGKDFYTVQYNGDDVVFDTVEDAKKFVDDLPEEDRIEESKFDSFAKKITRAADDLLFDKEDKIQVNFSDYEKEIGEIMDKYDDPIEAAYQAAYYLVNVAKDPAAIQLTKTEEGGERLFDYLEKVAEYEGVNAREKKKDFDDFKKKFTDVLFEPEDESLDEEVEVEENLNVLSAIKAMNEEVVDEAITKEAIKAVDEIADEYNPKYPDEMADLEEEPTIQDLMNKGELKKEDLPELQDYYERKCNDEATNVAELKAYRDANTDKVDPEKDVDEDIDLHSVEPKKAGEFETELPTGAAKEVWNKISDLPDDEFEVVNDNVFDALYGDEEALAKVYAIFEKNDIPTKEWVLKSFANSWDEDESLDLHLDEDADRFYLDNNEIVDSKDDNKTVGELWDDGTVKLNKELTDAEKEQLKKDLDPNEVYFDEALDEEEVVYINDDMTVDVPKDLVQEESLTEDAKEDEKAKALSDNLGEEVHEENGIYVTETGAEYYILTEEEAKSKAVDEIRNVVEDIGLHAFSKDFQKEILNDYNCIDQSFVDDVIDQEIEYFQDEEESPDLIEYLENATPEEKLDYVISLYGEDVFAKEAAKYLNFEDVAAKAVEADGLGNFLSYYDGKEIDLGNNLFAYRIN